MRKKVLLIDYGSGNVLSVVRALEFVGASVTVSGNAGDVANAERIVLPGVGAFAEGMRGLHERHLVASLQQFAAADRPMLGICLGMQMLATTSDEFGTHSGLGVIPGRVVRIPNFSRDGKPQKIPAVGWAALETRHGNTAPANLLRGLNGPFSVYFVHSFHVMPDSPAAILAEYRLGGNLITAAIQVGNILGCQFHPEKSGAIGLAMLENFIAGN